jgi:hypothetical protein
MNPREFVTEILNEAQQRDVLDPIVRFLSSKGVESVRAEFGFVLKRDLRGEQQGEDTVVPLSEVQQFIERGLSEGTIEWSGTSNFRLLPVGLDLELTLCNDSDLHFASSNPALLMELSRLLSDHGVKVFDSGKLVSKEW